MLTINELTLAVQNHLCVTTTNEIDFLKTSSPLTLYFLYRGFRGTLQLSPVYTYYVQKIANGQNTSQALFAALSYAEAIFFEMLNEQSADFALVKDKIFPLIKNVTAHDFQLFIDGDFIVHPYVLDLGVAYVIEKEETLDYISQKTLESWQISENELKTLAMKNFQEQKDSPPDRVSSFTQQGAAYCYQTLDGFDATRILFSSRLREMKAKLRSHKMIVAIPERDCLIAFSASVRTQQVIQFLTDTYNKSNYPISSRFYEFDGKHLSFVDYVPIPLPFINKTTPCI
jgi:uncharacterized protein YtpQ (UPF0354 family)